MIILIILIIVLLLSLSLINKTLRNKSIKLDNNKLNENTIKRKQFSMFVENSNGEYEEYISSNMFPEGYKINLNKSKCVDNNGLEVKNVLSGNGNKVTVTSNKTVFCYVYFDKDNSMTKYLIENVSSEELWNSPLEEDGYRYVGTNPDNYVCFGTNDKNECVNDTDKYMYRIIGIFEDEVGNKHTKLIKKEALNTAYAWHSDSTTDVDWNNSDLYKGINESYFLTNSDYSYMQDSTWAGKITTWNYTMTNTKTEENYNSNNIYGLHFNSNTGKTLYLYELNRKGKANDTCYYINGLDGSTVKADCNVGNWKISNAKIGLMYASDYALSLGNDALNYVGAKNYSTMKTGWMHLSNNDTNAPNSYEWTISRRGIDGDSLCRVWIMYSSGTIDYYRVNLLVAARPVFYLESDVELSGGTGTSTDPYIIKND